jgi:hypothetical protein
MNSKYVGDRDVGDREFLEDALARSPSVRPYVARDMDYNGIEECNTTPQRAVTTSPPC